MRCLNVREPGGGDGARHKKAWKRIKSGGVFAGGLDVAADPFGITGGAVGKALDPLGLEGSVTGKIVETFDPPKVEGVDETAVALPLSPKEETDTDAAAMAAAEAAKKRRGRGAAGTILTSPLGVTQGARIERKSLLG